MKQSLLWVLLVLTLVPVGCQETETEGTQATAGESNWIQLINERSLDGWVKKGGAATYRVEDSSIVGTSVRNSENTFLVTEKTFGDFVLEFDVQVHDSLNSGVQIRSKVRPSGRVYGPQVEIEASQETGGDAGYIYGEATGRGWLVPDSQRTPHKHFRDGAWNHYRVRAEGPRIQTWVNGTQVIDLTHKEIYQTHKEGFIGLQVHGVGDEGPYRVQWKNIRVRQL